MLVTARSDSRLRGVFAPKYGYLEDPATGSGNSALGHYLIELGQWKDGGVILEQGPYLEIPNIVKLRWTLDDHGKRCFSAARRCCEYTENIS